MVEGPYKYKGLKYIKSKVKDTGEPLHNGHLGDTERKVAVCCREMVVMGR